MKKMIFLVLALNTTLLFAGPEQIDLHIECTEQSDDCVQYNYNDVVNSKNYILLKKEPGFVIKKAQVVKARVNLDMYGAGQRVINMELTSEAGDAFARITRESISKRLAIVYDGKIITAPMVQQEITGGKFQITSGAGANMYEPGELEKISWLKEMIDKSTADENFWPRVMQFSFLGFMLLLVGITVYFIFVKKDKPKEN